MSVEYGHMSTWVVYEYINTWVYEYVSMTVCEYMSTGVYDSINTRNEYMNICVIT